MTGHFGMRVRRLVCPSDTHGQQELATPYKSAKDKLGLDRRQDNVAPWLCAGITYCLREESGGSVRAAMRLTHLGITRNSRQPFTHVPTVFTTHTGVCPDIFRQPGQRTRHMIVPSRVQQWRPFSSLALLPIGGDWDPSALQLNTGH